MASDETKRVTPKLRFPEFRNAAAWGERNLASVFATITNGKANAQDHVEDGEYPLFDRSEVIKRSNTFMFDSEAIIIPGEGMRFQPRYYTGKFNLHQRAYALMECEANSTFAFYALDRSKELLAQKAVKSTVLSLRLPIIEKFTIGYPDPAEQRKIADCLSSLDAAVAAQGRKLEALRAHKRGLMQALFPREGQTRPRLRFPQFHNGGEWEPTSLARLVEVASGQVDPKEPPYCDMPHVGGENIEPETGDLHGLRSAREDGVISGKYPFGANDILYSKIRPALNKVAAPDFEGICSADIYPLRPSSDELLRDYLVYLLRFDAFVKYATKHSERGKIPKINREALLAYTAPIPQPAEQQHIAACLSSLDGVIAAASAKLAALQTHKKGLTQQLFPSPE